MSEIQTKPENGDLRKLLESPPMVKKKRYNGIVSTTCVTFLTW